MRSKTSKSTYVRHAACRLERTYGQRTGHGAPVRLHAEDLRSVVVFRAGGRKFLPLCRVDTQMATRRKC